jgi:hypothetical protein
LPAAGPEELSAYEVIGVTCNKTSSVHIQKIKTRAQGFQLPSGAPTKWHFIHKSKCWQECQQGSLQNEQLKPAISKYQLQGQQFQRAWVCVEALGAVLADVCFLCASTNSRSWRAHLHAGLQSAEVDNSAILILQQRLRQQLHIGLEAIPRQKLERKKRSIDTRIAFEYFDAVVGVNEECIHSGPKVLSWSSFGKIKAKSLIKATLLFRSNI